MESKIRFKDRSGQQFGRLEVLAVRQEGLEENPHFRRLVWLCECACGAFVELSPSRLKSSSRQIGCGQDCWFTVAERRQAAPLAREEHYVFLASLASDRVPVKKSEKDKKALSYLLSSPILPKAG
jgi:hypothetical protein